MNQYLQLVGDFLNREKIKTIYNDEEKRFETLYNGSHVDVRSRVCFLENSRKLEHIVFLDVKIPDEKQSDICVLINLINDSLNICHFMLTRQNYVICIARIYIDGDAIVNDAQIERFWRAPLNTMFDFEKTVMQVAFGDIEPKTAMYKFWKEREEAQQARVKTSRQSIKETIKKWVRDIGKN